MPSESPSTPSPPKAISEATLHELIRTAQALVLTQAICDKQLAADASEFLKKQLRAV